MEPEDLWKYLRIVPGVSRKHHIGSAHTALYATAADIFVKEKWLQRSHLFYPYEAPVLGNDIEAVNHNL